MTKKEYKKQKRLGYVIIIFCVICSLPFFNWSKKSIENVKHISGIINSKQILKEHFKGKNERYTFVFTLDNLDKKLGVFLGSGEAGIIEGNYYNNLFEIGQPITVYYDENTITKYENITRLIYKIEYKGQVIIERGAPKGWILGIIILFPIPIMIILLIWLKNKCNKEKKEL